MLIGTLVLLVGIVHAAGGLSHAVETLEAIDPKLVSPQGADDILSPTFMTSFWVLVCFGVTGYLMRCWDYPVAPMIVGLILGPMAESQFRRAMQISLGDPWVFFKNPGSATLLALAVLALVAPLLFKQLRSFRGEDA